MAYERRLAAGTHYDLKYIINDPISRFYDPILKINGPILKLMIQRWLTVWFQYREWSKKR